MKTRKEVARFIETQMGPYYKCRFEKGKAHHYGWQELRELMDFIYESEPLDDEKLLFDSIH